MTPLDRRQTAGPRSSRGLALACGGIALAALAGGVWAIAGSSNKTGYPPVSPAHGFTSPHLRSQDRPDQTDPSISRALAAIAAEADDSKRAESLETFITGIPAGEIRSTLETLRHLSADDGATQAISSLLRRWTTLDAAAAARWAERLQPGVLRDHSLSNVAIEWANNDLANSSAWARQLPNPAEHDAALLAIASEALRTDPTEALQLVVDLPAGSGRDPVLTHAAMEWASRDGPAALAWARQVADESLRPMLLAAITTAWSDTDPESAARSAALEIPEGRSQSDAVMGIIARWAQTQPELATEWADQLAPGELRQNAFDCIDALEKARVDGP